MNEKWKKLRFTLANRGVVLLGMGCLTGVFVGVTVTFYNLGAKYGESFAKGIYEAVRDNPAWIPLLFLALFVGAFFVAVLSKLVPMVKGSGIPQTEGATRGVMHFNWWKVLVTMAASSLFSIFMGLSAGAEGPSLQIGGACGNGIATMLGRKEIDRRYQITGGASAGLAVAFNAPLTGLVFAFEEAHKRFTPEIFICAFSSVATAILTRNLLLDGMGFSVSSTFANFLFVPAADTSFAVIGFAALSSVIAGLIGVGFYKLCLAARRWFGKLTFWRGMGKMTVPFLLAGVCGLVTVNVMGGGHALIESLGTRGGTQEMSVENIFGSPMVVTLIIVLVLKLVVTVTNLGAGVPCGVFIPMLAIGACIGALCAKMCGAMGMSADYSDIITMITMAAFFTAVVKAPLTAIVMVVELTWSWTALLPVLVGVAIGYMINSLFKLQPLYEQLLELMIAEQHLDEGVKRESMKVTVLARTPAVDHVVRDILWPSNTVVVAILRDGARIVPDSETVMREGDELVLVGSTNDRRALAELIYEITGDPDGDPDVHTPPATPNASEEAQQ